ncbi:hypothetical protein AB833_19965 [Chromatiales bacterium (ex Bugula neritina AB1)]|nr:hypothetical protein AB833_19965 [Chromatiales bacterium (ex Bugula neritina AB1)]
MSEAVIFTGAQASGKSTYYIDRYFRTHVRISLDLLRTRRREQKLLDYCLNTEMAFVIDNTNLTIKDRRRYINQISLMPQYEFTGCYFQSKIEPCLSRNSSRSEAESVPDIGVRNTHAKLEMPSIDEGFTRLWYISIARAGGFIVEPWSDEI